MKTILPLLMAATFVCAESPDFNRDVRPILSNKCFACHGVDGHKAKADLQLDTAENATKPRDGGAAIVPGDRKGSLVWQRITSKDPEEKMPPEDSLYDLSAEEIETLGAWIDAGAKYKGHWAFQAIGKATVRGHAVDHFVQTEINKTGLVANGAADKTALVRRLSLDLTGLPPTVDMTQTFLADDRPDAYERLVDQLLSSAAAAERLTVDWLDGARYADTNGYSIDDHRDMWIWRDWVINAFHTNMPFDQFTREQIAGDLMPDATEQQKVATGFLRNSMNTHEGGTIAEEYRVTYVADKVDTVSTVFMGLSLKCAQCHDHKYDPLTQKEYYNFFAFFNQSTEPGKGATNANTKPLITAESVVRTPELAKEDAAERIDALRYLRHHPPAELRMARDAWIQQEQAKLDPTAKPEKKQPVVAMAQFPKKLPEWIWTAADKQALFARFQKRFNLKQPPKQAKLWMSCDDAATLWVNGKKIGTTDLWMKPGEFVIKNLRKGKNTIAVRGTNGAGTPAGLCLSLAMQDPKGKVTHVTSDATWLAKVCSSEKLCAGPDNWYAADAVLKWPKAVSQGAYGVAPWGKKAPVNDVTAPPKPSLADALRVAESKRSDAQWQAINDAYGKVSAPFRNHFKPVYLKQIDTEIKVLSQTAKSGKATTMIMDFHKRDTHILSRGEYDKPREKVVAGTPAVLPPLNNAGDAATRLDLANWLVRDDHPLVARVIVNRYWQMLFGTGLVKTADDFGAQGEWPSHLELLDHLAADFIGNGWDLRRLLKQIVTSETYKRSSVATPGALAADPYNRLLARGPRFRLAAEFVRDNALAISGLLDPQVGGMSVHPYQPDGLWAEVSHYGYGRPFTSQKYLRGQGRHLYRRSMYTAWKRTSPPPTMAIFDAPTRETCVVRRLNTNTPMQALVLQNDPQYVEASRAFGAKMKTQGTVDAGVEYGVQAALSRLPTAHEKRVLTQAYQRYLETYRKDAESATALLAIGDLPVPKGDVPSLAAWTMVASTIFNMDEAMTRQ